MTNPPPTRVPRLVWAIGFATAAAVLALGWTQLARERSQPTSPPLPLLATAPDFTFTSQTGQTVTASDLAGKIWIADFIFPRCAGPCPRMTERMSELQRALGTLGTQATDDVRLVSISVDPEHDQPAVLAQYAARFGADPARWLFLTGPPAAIETFATKGMLLALAKDGEGAPIHAQKFVVVDAKGKIRAYHDLDNPNLITNLVNDIRTLRAESKP